MGIFSDFLHRISYLIWGMRVEKPPRFVGYQHGIIQKELCRYHGSRGCGPRIYRCASRQISEYDFEKALSEEQVSRSFQNASFRYCGVWWKRPASCFPKFISNNDRPVESILTSIDIPMNRHGKYSCLFVCDFTIWKKAILMLMSYFTWV